MRINPIESYNRIKFFKIFFCFAIDSDNAKLYNISEKSEKCISHSRMSTRKGCFPHLREQSIFFQKEAMNLKDRKRRRENRRIKQREERIDKRNDCGAKDLTAYNAVRQIMTNGKANIVLA